jgi:4-hydroxy-tetrahydrodipicolinate synthase
MPTPLAGDDELDVAGLGRLIDHLIDGGASGLFLLGTTGEGPSLSRRLRYEVVTEACRLAAGRTPVLIGISDTSLMEAAALARAAAEAGATAVVATTPYYFPIAQVNLLRFMEALAAASPLPLLLYNMPSHTKVAFEIDTLRKLSELPNIAGVKDTSGSMMFFHQLVRLAAERRPDWSLFVGPEELLGESVLFGGHGGICGGANLWPRLYVALYQAAARGDLAEVRRLHAKVTGTMGTLFRARETGASFAQSIKCALSCIGICENRMALPLVPASAEREQEMRRALAEIDVKKAP